jgi:hypothetical protein
VVSCRDEFLDADRAGLTARTFFRYFADKREVLFNGSERLQQTMVDALARYGAITACGGLAIQRKGE